MNARVQSHLLSWLALITCSFPSGNSLRRVKLARVWGKVCRYRSVALCRLRSRIYKSTDLEAIERLGKEMAAPRACDPACAAKYTDYAFWLPFNLERIGRLSLHRSSPLRILDIGCGPGYFLAAALACGHDAYGVDAPASALTGIEARVYGEMLAALSCDNRVAPLLIERFVPMALSWHDLDLITAFWICFNRHHQPDEWGSAEWQFFVQDAMSYLREGGVLYLELNANHERYPSLEWYDDETLRFFRSVGTVNRNIIRITKGMSPQWGKNRKQP